MQKGQRPVYEDPDKFFALTFPTYNLRELVKDVCLRLAGKTDKAYRKLSVNYGGGKTHTLIALRHLAHDPAALPDLLAVREFEATLALSRQRRGSRRCALTKSTWKKVSRQWVPMAPTECSSTPGHSRLSTGGRGRPQTHPRRRQRRGARNTTRGTARGRICYRGHKKRASQP